MRWFAKFAAEIRRHQGEDAAETYFSIGHSDVGDLLGVDAEPDDEWGVEPNYIWALIGGRVETSPEEEGSHGIIWGHDVCDRTWKGRYDGSTGDISVVSPGFIQKDPPIWLLTSLRDTFDVTAINLF